MQTPIELYLTQQGYTNCGFGFFSNDGGQHQKRADAIILRMLQDRNGDVKQLRTDLQDVKLQLKRRNMFIIGLHRITDACWRWHCGDKYRNFKNGTEEKNAWQTHRDLLDDALLNLNCEIGDINKQ